MTSFGSQFGFHDVIYHKRHRNVDNRRRNVVFTTTWRSKYTLKCVSVKTRVAGNSDSLFKIAVTL